MQSKDIVNFTFGMPHLTLQRPEDLGPALLNSPWRTQLQELQVGEMQTQLGFASR